MDSTTKCNNGWMIEAYLIRWFEAKTFSGSLVESLHAKSLCHCERSNPRFANEEGDCFVVTCLAGSFSQWHTENQRIGETVIRKRLLGESLPPKLVKLRPADFKANEVCPGTRSALFIIQNRTSISESTHCPWCNPHCASGYTTLHPFVWYPLPNICLKIEY